MTYHILGVYRHEGGHVGTHFVGISFPIEVLQTDRNITANIPTYFQLEFPFSGTFSNSLKRIVQVLQCPFTGDLGTGQVRLDHDRCQIQAARLESS